MATLSQLAPGIGALFRIFTGRSPEGVVIFLRKGLVSASFLHHPFEGRGGSIQVSEADLGLVEVWGSEASHGGPCEGRFEAHGLHENGLGLVPFVDLHGPTRLEDVFPVRYVERNTESGLLKPSKGVHKLRIHAM